MLSKRIIFYFLRLTFISSVLFSSLYAQSPQAGLTSSPSDTSGVLTICQGASVTFTGFQSGLASAPKSYEFLILRTGTTTITARARNDSSNWVAIAATDFLHGDQILVRAYDRTTLQGGGTSYTSRRITIQITTPPAITLSSDAPGNTFCDGDTVNFSVLPQINGATYAFYIDGKLEQGPNTLSQFSTQKLTDNAVVRVEVTSAGCMSQGSVQLFLNNITDPGTIGFSGATSPQLICFGSTPPLIVSTNTPTIDGTPLAATSTQYQWESSEDGTTWAEIINANAAQYQPPVLTTTTFFRRIVWNIENGSRCEAVSNAVEVQVEVDLTTGGVTPQNQTLCENELPNPISVAADVQGIGISYQWEASLDGVNFTPLTVAATAADYQPQTVTQTTFYRRVTTNASGSCSTTTNIHTLTIINLDAGVLDTAQNAAICFGTQPPINVLTDTPVSPGNTARSASSNGVLSYQWERSTDNGVSWQDIAGATLNQYMVGTLNQTTWFRRKVMATLNGITCSATSENTIEIDVAPQITAWITSSQSICEGETINPLTLNVEPQPGVTYAIQWQMASPSQPFQDITGQTSSQLVFNTGGSWVSSQTAEYRVMLTVTGSQTTCTVFTIPAEISIAQNHTIKQVEGPTGSQFLCDGDTMLPITFEYGGGATHIEALDNLSAAGVSVSHMQADRRYRITGTPRATINLAMLTEGNVCSPTTLDYKIEVSPDPAFPDVVSVDGHSVSFGGSSQIPHPICEGTATTQLGATFFDPEATKYTSLEWELVSPLDAGTVNRSTGLIQWDAQAPAFHGTATFRVRGTNCGEVSSWHQFQIEVIERVFPPPPLQTVSGTIFSRNIPLCQTHAKTTSTQFFVGDVRATPAGNLFLWSIQDSEGKNPGTIGATTGSIQWNPGYFGTVTVFADPTDCHGTVSSSLRLQRSFTIPQAPTGSLHLYVAPGSRLPLCPSETGGFTTNFDSSTTGVRWTIDNTLAGTIDENTGVLTWDQNFSGTFNVTASTRPADQDCAVISSSIPVTIPALPELTISSGLNTNVQFLCQNSNITTITYAITGAADNAAVSGLPNGLQGETESIAQVTTLALTGNSNAVGEAYTIMIDSQAYTYTTLAANETPAQIATALLGLMQNDPTVLSQNTGAGQITFTGRGAGRPYSITTRSSNTAGSTFSNATTTTAASLNFLIHGVVNAAAGEYVYTVRTGTQSGTCASAQTTGTIHVQASAEVQLQAGANDAQEVCDGSAITPITYVVNNATPIVENLPQGITFNFVGNQLVLSGTLNTAVTTTTVFNYTIKTEDNSYGCHTAATSGTITVFPAQELELFSSPSTAQQEVCEGESIINIIYQLRKSATNAVVTGLPPGVSQRFDVNTQRVTISGIPDAVTSFVTYNYTVATTGDQCTSTSLTGSIGVHPTPALVLTSGVDTENQTGRLAICDGQAIRPITYEISGKFQNVTVTGLPQNLSYVTSGTQLTISGTPQEGNRNAKVFTYTITTVGSCATQTQRQGRIEVSSQPQINKAFIESNDLTHVSCPGGNDGAIRIPTQSPDFDLRITGQLNHVRQVDHISYSNTPTLSNVFTVEVDGVSISHTVIPSVVSGPVQTLNEVVTALAAIINSRTEMTVTAAVQSSTILALTAKVAGTPFTVNNQSIAPTSTQVTSTHTNHVPNRISQYTYQWSGPNGFTSTALAIENLFPGFYELTVSVNNCVSEKIQFEIEAPQPLTTSVQSCDEVILVELSGGRAPYTVTLNDANGNTLETMSTQETARFTGLSPGSNYLVRVQDAGCSQPQDTPVQLAFSLEFNDQIPQVISDYCNDGTGKGSIRLAGTNGHAVSGGSGQYTYLWKGPNNSEYFTQDITQLNPGTYVLTVTDSILGCSLSKTFEIGTVDPLTIVTTSNTPLDADGGIPLSCFGDSDALIEVRVEGGVGNYTYTWSRDGITLPGANGPRIENLIAGTYRVTVRDNAPSGITPQPEPCSISKTFEVQAPEQIQVITKKLGGNASYCPEDNKASFSVEVLGGTPPFTLQLNNGAAGTFTIPDDQPFTISELQPAVEGPEYQLELTDANGCTAATTDAMTLSFETIAPLDFRVEVTPIDCQKGEQGVLSLILIDGAIEAPEKLQVEWISASAHYYHTWESHEGQLENISSAGKYTVVVRQGKCELYRQDNIILEDVNNQILYFESVNVQEGGCSGSEAQIELSLAGGTPPYTIYWERFEAVTTTTVVSSTTSSATETLTTTENKWVRLPQFENNSIATGLEVGSYRATVSGASTSGSGSFCGNEIQTDVLIIGAPKYQLSRFEVDPGAQCTTTASYTIRFAIDNALTDPLSQQAAPIIKLDNVLMEAPDLIQLNATTYEIRNVAVGQHTLNIVPDNPNEKCSILHPFTVEAIQPITYNGTKQFSLDACSNSTSIQLDTALVSGGVPFELNQLPVYDYQWTFTPDDGGNQQVFVGTEIPTAFPGVYELIIRDQQQCESTPIRITVTGYNQAERISVQGTLVDRNDPNKRVKVLAPRCDGTTPDGQIGIQVNGGIRPYTIKWFKEEITSTGASNTVGWEELQQFRNTTQLSGLSSGKYRLEIKSLISECPDDVTNSFTFHEEVIIVPNSSDFFVLEGPFPDTNLCKGLPGLLSVSIYERTGGELSFYYNDEFVEVRDVIPVENGKRYTIYIETPVERASVKITSPNGCVIEIPFDVLAIGAPSFDYTSPSFEGNGKILAREEVTFTNTSALPYLYSEWLFGDGTPPEEVLSGSPEPIRHSFGISGVYFVTLRNYNSLGCSVEITLPIEVGKGYNILAPNVFTPNFDLINDTFKPIISGFQSVTFNVYDSFGNLLYTEGAAEPNPETQLEGLKLKGWDGRNETDATFYIYVIKGVLLDGTTQIEHTGIFNLLR